MRLNLAGGGEAVRSELHWKTLRYFNFYRFCISCVLFASSLSASSPAVSSLSILTPEHSLFHLGVTSVYLLATTFSVIGLHYYRHRFNGQLTFHVLVDVLALALLMHASGGLRSGLGTLLLVTLAGAGLVGEGRLVLFYAALATLAVLFEQTFRAFHSSAEAADFFQAGLLSAGFFAIAISARLLARRVLANEELAQRRGRELRNQTLVSQRIIEEMQDGVLVVDRGGNIQQRNPRAEQLLGLRRGEASSLHAVSPSVAQAFGVWCEQGGEAAILGRATASGADVRVRFAATASSERDVLVFVEDMGRLQEQARQLKLAALGRLTAGIAHEIRNPLSAISHAGELLREECASPVSERLLRIVHDNARRVERIVSDVLELGRRDRTHRERLDLRSALSALIEDSVPDSGAVAGVVRCEFSGLATMLFDRSHFQQVFANLLQNALRHASGKEGSVQVRVENGADEGWVIIHVMNDGPSIEEKYREQIFEPFFTTHSRGTGLGLYIARELCEANGASIGLRETPSGVDFCVSGRSGL